MKKHQRVGLLGGLSYRQSGGVLCKCVMLTQLLECVCVCVCVCVCGVCAACLSVSERCTCHRLSHI